MSTTLTIRMSPEERERIVRKATETGLTVSELVREILRQGLAERRIGAKAGHLKGRLKIKRSAQGSWRGKIRQRNWRE